jgi:V8-like Glu-specific endopeptidase
MECSKWALVVAIIFNLFGLFNGQAEAKTPKEIYRDFKDSVLMVASKEADGNVSTGTAFAIDNDGTFVTAAHVVVDSQRLTLIDRNKVVYGVKEVLWIDKDNDLAIIQSERKDFKPVPLATYKALEVGERFAIVSYPRGDEIGGFESTLSEGMLSSIRETFVSERIEKQSPIYDKENPKIYKAVPFYTTLKKECSQSKEQPSSNVKILKCSNGRTAIIDKENNNNVLYDNYDIAIRQGNSVYYFENKNKALIDPEKTIGIMLQYTTPISPGSSGGPIFNENGEVVAIVNSFLEDAQSVNFGRPIDYLPQEFINKNISAINPSNQQKDLAFRTMLIQSIHTVYEH